MEKIPKMGHGFVVSYLVQSKKINKWYPNYTLLGTELEVGTGTCDIVLFSPTEINRFTLVEAEISKVAKPTTQEKIQNNLAIKAIIDHLTRLRKGISIVFDVPYHRIKYGVVLNPKLFSQETIEFIKQKGINIWFVSPNEIRSFYKKKFGLEIITTDF